MINPTKTKNLNINRIKKQNDEILLGKCFGVVWLIKVAKYLKFWIFYGLFGSFIREELNAKKKEMKKKPNKKDDLNIQNIIKNLTVKNNYW